MNRSRYYVGFAGPSRPVFKSDETPTKAVFPQYNAVVGPFRTKRAAMLCGATYPNPHINRVADAERIATARH